MGHGIRGRRGSRSGECVGVYVLWGEVGVRTDQVERRWTACSGLVLYRDKMVLSQNVIRTLDHRVTTFRSLGNKTYKDMTPYGSQVTNLSGPV